MVYFSGKAISFCHFWHYIILCMYPYSHNDSIQINIITSAGISATKGTAAEFTKNPSSNGVLLSHWCCIMVIPAALAEESNTLSSPSCVVWWSNILLQMAVVLELTEKKKLGNILADYNHFHKQNELPGIPGNQKGLCSLFSWLS